MGWESFTEWVIAVYKAKELGTIDPRLEPMDVGDCSFTEEELERIERWADELLAQ